MSETRTFVIEVLGNWDKENQVRVPSRKEQVTVTVDWEGVALALGSRAVNNKSGACRELGGMIVVKHVR